VYKTPEEQIENIIRLALEEDDFENDVTSKSLIYPGQEGAAVIIVKTDGILACVDIARPIFHMVDPSLEVNILIKDGVKVKPNDRVVSVSGNLTGILSAERTVLNFLSHLSGIATLTSKYVDMIKGTKAVIRDTRKTMPGLRLLEKYAVTVGGGKNHRLHLGDGILIKDNHVASIRKGGLSLKDITNRARQNTTPDTIIEIEVDTVEEAVEAAQTGVDIILLDNMNLEDMKKVVELASGKVKLEASGGITLDNIKDVAMIGVDYISIGALTHSVKALDFSLEVEK
jgi:nicotinate-nucleotide pyrophosphorylase (carboxylating)